MTLLQVMGCQVHVDDTGGPGEPVLFLHGFLFDGRQFEAQVGALSDRYRCVTVDWPGQGRSERSVGGYSTDHLTDYAVAVIESLGLGGVHLAGLSMGGFAGMRIAARRPDLVRSLTLLNTSAAPHARTKLLKQLALAAVARVAGVSLPPIVVGIEGEMYGRTFVADPHSDTVREVWRRRWANTDRAALVSTLLGFMTRADVRDEIRSITAPTLVITGAEDASLPPPYSREIHSLIPGSQLVEIPGAGHSSPLEQPAAVTTAISTFLADVSAARPT